MSKSQEERIAALEAKIAELERRIASIDMPRTYGPLPVVGLYYTPDYGSTDSPMPLPNRVTCGSFVCG